LDYPTAGRHGPPTALDQRFDVLESWNLQIGRKELKATPDHAFRLLVPAITLGLALEALFDFGHFFAARTLHRSVYERVGSYFLIESDHEKFLPIWDAGWSNDWKIEQNLRRPSMPKLLASIPRLNIGSQAVFVRAFIRSIHNIAIHSDPRAVLMLLVQSKDAELVSGSFVVGPQFHDLAARQRAEIENSLVIDCLIDALKDAFPDLDIDEAVA
jgi:hypothetical protein